MSSKSMSGMLTANHGNIGLRSKVRSDFWRSWRIHSGSPFHHDMSWWKGEPEWMRQLRQKSLRTFERKPMLPWFAVNMPDIDFDDIYYYIKPTSQQVDEWDDLPEQLKATYEKLGIPEAE